MKWVLCLAALLLWPAGSALAVAPIEVVGLFRDAAVVRSNEGQEMLRVGQTGKNGVTLISADAMVAVVEYRGERYRLSLTDRVGSTFNEADRAAITINSDELGQYRVRGAINGHFVNFLVDTGASVVAVSSRQARAIGLNYRVGQKGIVQTAQGTTESFFVTLDTVTVGGITTRGVSAAVIEGDYPKEILLGMSFLSDVSITERAGVLTLRAMH